MRKIRFNAREKVPHFVGLYDFDAYDDAVLLGSRGSSKTWNVSNVISLRTAQNPSMRSLMMRDVAGQISQSILYTVKQRLQQIAGAVQIEHLFDFQERTVASTNPNLVSNVLITSKGFRKSHTLQDADLKGLEDFDNYVMEEATDVIDKSRIDTLRGTARKEGRKIYMIANSVPQDHWMVQRYFDLTQSEEYEDFLVPTPKTLDRVYINFSTYKDNKYLTPRTRAEYDAYGDPNSYLYDPYTYAKDFLCLIPKAGVNSYFDLSRVKWGDQTKYTDIDGLRIFKHPIRGRKYCIGVDNASGFGTDYCALHVLDVLTGEQVASAELKMQEPEWALFIVKVGRAYNNAYIAIERNEAGRVVVRFVIEEYGYDRTLMFTHDTKYSPSTKFGFATTVSTRPVMLGELRAALNQGGLIINCTHTFDQLKRFRVIDGKPQAEQGYNDDRVMSLGIAWQCRQFSLR